ncbi:MAG: CAP domain-containing protein [Sulfolobales archaeon]
MNNVIHCLDDSINDVIIIFMQPAILNFVKESSYTRSVDGFLVKFGTLVSMLEDTASIFKVNANDLLTRVLACAEISEALRPLAKYADDVKRLVSIDPRHKKLYPYLPLIYSYLSRLPPTSIELDLIRPSMSELEKEKTTQSLTKPFIVSEQKPVREKEEKTLEPSEREIKVEVSRSKPEVAQQGFGYLAKKRGVSRLKVAAFMSLIILAILISYASGIEPVKNCIDTAGRFLVSELSNVWRTPTLLDIKLNVLNELNKIRAAYNLPPVQLLNLSIAQYRADDMVRNAYYGHCDLNRVPTTYYYTLLGGAYAMEENIGYVGKCLFPPLRPADIYASDAMNYALDILNEMVYNDASSFWGHRDSLLDPTNNYVDIGVAWGKGIFIIVLQMNKVWVFWSDPPSYINNIFRACGRLLLNGSEITQVLIYKYVENGFLSWLTLNIRSLCTTANATCGSYSLGNPVAVVVPSPNKYYPGIETIVASKWVQQGDNFCIEFTWMPKEKGIYTIAIFAKNTIGISHPYDKDRFKDYVPILEYTVNIP